MRHLVPQIARYTDPLLTDVLDAAWFVSPANTPRGGVMQADGRVGLVLSATMSGNGVAPGALRPDSHGVSAVRMRLAPDVSMVGVRFEPGAFRALFGLSFRAFCKGQTTSSLARLERTLGSVLRELTAEAATLEQACAEVADTARSLLREPDLRWVNIQRTVQLLNDPEAQVDSNYLAKRSGLGRRQFERQFAEHVGMSPRVFLRIQRVNRARHRLRAGTSLARAAQWCGFADQAHLTREFRKLLGVTPLQYQRRVLSY